ncbi:MAG: UrcA family protein [Alphaproteobacteria bacterium]
MSVRTHLTALAAAVVMVGTFAAPAKAVVEVPVASYDLQEVKDLDTLHREIVDAATDLCREEFRNWVLGSVHKQIDACIEATVDGAIDESGIVGLQEFHDAIDVSLRYETDRPSDLTLLLASN